MRATGFHFQLDKRVPGTMEPLAPALQAPRRRARLGRVRPRLLHHPRRAARASWTTSASSSTCRPDAFRFSRATLTEYGNIASAVVLDALRRLFDEGGAADRARGLLAGFGPGITAEMALGRWSRTP